MLYRAEIEGHNVWVLVERLHEQPAGSSEFVDTGTYVCAFKFDVPPGIVVGEYVRDADERIRRFPTPDAAAAAGLEAARTRMK